MNAFAIIPARGGSKGVPRKNLRFVNGRPLLAWSIWAAQEAGLEVYVSSDDDAILDCARVCEAQTIRRPPELATDEALTDPVLIHACQALSKAEGYVVLLQPTSPVRRPGLVAECVKRAQETKADCVLTAYPLHFVWWREGRYHTGPGMPEQEWGTQCRRRPRRQDMTARELMYHEDGSVYVTNVEHLMRTGCRVGGRVEIVETVRTVDIDTEEDLMLADMLLRQQEAKLRGEA